MSQTLLWYDLETFGRNPFHDRIAQFACIRTNENLEPVSAGTVLYCKLTPDYLPDPRACLIHGIDPQTVMSESIREYDFARAIHTEMSKPGTCVLGFNSIHFDDEFIRNLLYRNLLDPYEREWQNGNSRWDVINLFRAAHDLRPDGMVWPIKENGKPSFKLTALSGANGIPHENAHDALHDVDATIKLTWILKQAQPKLFSWYWNHRTAESLRPLINVVGEEILLHTSAAYTSQYGCTAPVLPLSILPVRKDSIIAVDLREDIDVLFDMTTSEIRFAYFKSAEEYNKQKQNIDPDSEQLELFPYFSPNFKVPLVELKLNRCPYLAPWQILDDESAERLHIDKNLCLERTKKLRQNPDLVQKIIAVFSTVRTGTETNDPDYTIYSGGFFSNTDKSSLKSLHTALLEQEPQIVINNYRSHAWEDTRIPQMLYRLSARNWPEILTEEEQKKWKSFCAERILFPVVTHALDYNKFRRVIRECAKTASHEEKILLRKLLAYGRTIKAYCTSV